jgi:hypothetical protein
MAFLDGGDKVAKTAELMGEVVFKNATTYGERSQGLRV